MGRRVILRLIIEQFLIDEIIEKRFLPLLVARPTGIAKNSCLLVRRPARAETKTMSCILKLAGLNSFFQP